MCDALPQATFESLEQSPAQREVICLLDFQRLDLSHHQKLLLVGLGDLERFCSCICSDSCAASCKQEIRLRWSLLA